MTRARGPGEIHPLAPPGERRVEQRVGRCDLDLVVPGEIAARIEEDLDGVRLVERLAVVQERRRDVRVLHLKCDVEVLVVPEHPRGGLLRARLAVERSHERSGALGLVPGRFRENTVDGDRSARTVHHVLAWAARAGHGRQRQREDHCRLRTRSDVQTSPARRTIRWQRRSCPPRRLENRSDPIRVRTA